MTIVSLEDDEPFWELMEEALQEEFPGAALRWIHSESDFHGLMESFAAEPPDIFLLDVMVKWADAAEEMPTPPKEVEEQGYYRAGLRCRNLLLERAPTAGIPVILFTVLEKDDVTGVTNDLPPNTVHLRKDVGFDGLVTQVRRLTGRTTR